MSKKKENIRLEQVLFKSSIKHALLIAPTRKGYKKLQKKHYFTKFSDGQIIFFQTKKDKREFDSLAFKNIDNLHPPCNNEVLGRFLGFPPIATQDFIQGIPRECRIGVDYHGLEFVVHHDHLSESLDYLKEHMPIPKKIIKRYNSSIFLCTVAFV